MAKTYEPIASTTLTAATSASFTGISGAFTDLVLTGTVIGTSGSALIRVGNGSVDAGANYSTTFLYGTGSVAASSRITSQTSIPGPSYGYGFDSTPRSFVLHIQSYSNGNVYKTFLLEDSTPSAMVAREVSLWRSTSAITDISFFVGVGNMTGTVSLYGIKAA